MKNFQNKAKIIKVSSVLRNIAFAGLIMWGLMIPIAFLTAMVALHVSQQPASSLTSFLVIPVYGFAFVTNLKIFRFLERLKQGCFFDARTVGFLNAAANWWLALWFYEIIFFALMQQPWKYPHDFSLYHFPPDLGGLWAALVLKFVAWFFREAQNLQEEQDLTV